MFEPSSGNANNSRPRPTGPATRSIPPLCAAGAAGFTATTPARSNQQVTDGSVGFHRQCPPALDLQPHRLLHGQRSEEHTSELQSLMRISYAVFCLNKKNTKQLNPSSLTR